MSDRNAESNMTPVLINPSPERLVIDFRPLGFHDVIVLGRHEDSSAHPQLEFHRHEHMIEICLLEKGQQVICRLVGQRHFGAKRPEHSSPNRK